MNEHSGSSRRAFLAGAAALGVAGCANTTTPIPVAGASSGGKGLLGDPSAGGRTDAFGIPLARRDYPVILPRTKKAAAGKPERGGELTVYNYADYINPKVLKEFGRQEGVSVRVSTFTTPDEAFTKLTSGLEFDVIFSSPERLSRYVGAELLQPLNLDLIPNLKANVWPELQSPSYDVGSRYSIPYTTYTTGIGWRNDKVDLDVEKLGWDAFWQAQSYRGRISFLDDEREALGMAMLRRGQRDLNTEDPAVVQRAGDDLKQMRDRTAAKINISGYETLPSGRIDMAQVWAGDMVNAVISYLPKGVSPDVLSYWYQQDGPVYNDYVGVGAQAKKPVMAHRFLNFLLDNDVAYENFTGYVGYQPPITKISPDVLTQRGIIPPSLNDVIVTRDTYANGNAYLGITAEGDRLWTTTFSKLKNG